MLQYNEKCEKMLLLITSTGLCVLSIGPFPMVDGQPIHCLPS
jgi:hypothetical protein